MPRSLLPLVGADPNRPDAVSLVGRYALGVTWQDRHGSIYPFDASSARPARAAPARRPRPPGRPRSAARRGALRVVWQDGHESTLPYADLRRQCPCAQCAIDAPGDRAVTDAPPPRRGLVVFGVMLGLFLGAMESTAVATAMPTVIASLGGLAIYSWVFSAYILAATISMPLWGRLADLYGRRTRVPHRARRSSWSGRCSRDSRRR